MAARARTSTIRGSTDLRIETAWGAARITTDGRSITAVRPPMAGGAYAELADAEAPGTPPLARRFAEALRRFLDGELVELATRDQVADWLDAAGITGFRRDVSLALFDVPRGVTLSYGELAALAGRPGAARAVGTACARNPIPIVVPCHRVVHVGARRGDVGSYGAATGSDYKRRLLLLEDAPLVRARVATDGG